MKNESTDQQTKAILKALDNAIETGPWDESNFLRVIGKKLCEIRDNFANQVQGGTHGLENESEDYSANRKVLRNDQQEVFISLYSSEGSNLQAWERILANLPKQMISRPIYSEVEAVEDLIKSKANKINEAYVAIHINQGDVLALSPDKTPVDKFGKPLLSLKARALSLENVTRFVHTSGVYHYVKGRLVKNMHPESD